MKEETKVPNPGSKEAIEKGCTCPVYDNHKGAGIPTATGPVFWYTEGCPVHKLTTMSHDKSHSECCNAKVLMGGFCAKCQKICVEVFDLTSHDKEGIPEWVLRFRHFWGYCNDPFEMEEFFSKILSSRDEALLGKLEEMKKELAREVHIGNISGLFEDVKINSTIDAIIKLIKEQ